MRAVATEQSAVVAKCREAIRHMLRRINEHSHIGYYCGMGTQAFAGLCEALALIDDLDTEKVKDFYCPKNARRPDVPEVQRHDVAKFFSEAKPRDGGRMLAGVLSARGYCPSWLEMTIEERVRMDATQDDVMDEFLWFCREAGAR